MNKPHSPKLTTSLRLTGGTFRGRPLVSPGNQATHPMGSRERLALMNSLGPLAGLDIIDAFAGTGALGLEALSRGARSVVFIESHPAAVRAIQQNVATLGLEDRTALFPGSVASFRGDFTSDLIFADPPYDRIPEDQLLRLTSFLAPGGRFVLSHPAAFDPATFATAAGLTLEKTRRYATAHISLFTRA